MKEQKKVEKGKEAAMMKEEEGMNKKEITGQYEEGRQKG